MLFLKKLKYILLVGENSHFIVIGIMLAYKQFKYRDIIQDIWMHKPQNLYTPAAQPAEIHTWNVFFCLVLNIICMVYFAFINVIAQRKSIPI